MDKSSLTLDLNNIKGNCFDLSCLEPEPGRLEFPDGSTYEFTAKNLEEKDRIGEGSYGGEVLKMVHKPSGQLMAVKRVRAPAINVEKRTEVLRELKIMKNIESQNCEDIVRYYGALFQDGDCWICMELLDCSLHIFYQSVYEKSQRIPERIVGFVTAAVVRALNYLKEEHDIIHRDVKPSNILLDRRGAVKLCDFGISGYLVNSIAKTHDIGCRIYMAPERVLGNDYDVRSDVWSLGISLIEICIGRFPWNADWSNAFEQLQAVVHGDPYVLTAEYYSIELVNFVNRCVIKETDKRPKYAELVKDPFFLHYNIADPWKMIEERAFFGNHVSQFLPIDIAA